MTGRGGSLFEPPPALSPVNAVRAEIAYIAAMMRMTFYVLGILLLSVAGGPGYAQQIPPGQSETQKDVDKRTHRAIVPGEHENTRCYTGILIEAYNKFGVFGTIDTIPTELMNTLPAGVTAVSHYCNSHYRACEKAAQSFRPRLGLGQNGCL